MGWHIDSSQKLGIRNYTSDALLKWHSYWIKDLEFSTNLLKQFMEDLNEDIDTLKKDISITNRSSDSNGSYRDNINHALSIMQVFNTVLSCIKSLPHETITVLDEESLSWFDTVLNIMFLVTENGTDNTSKDKTDTSQVIPGEFEEDVIVTGLQSILLLVQMCPNICLSNDDENETTLYDTKVNELSKLLKHILHHFLDYSYQGQVCVLNYCFQMQSLALELTTQEHNIGENMVKEILNSRVIVNAAFSNSSKVSIKRFCHIVILSYICFHITPAAT